MVNKRCLLRSVVVLSIKVLLVCDQGSLVGVCMEEYKSLCAAVTISAALFNMHIHTD